MVSNLPEVADWGHTTGLELEEVYRSGPVVCPQIPDSKDQKNSLLALQSFKKITEAKVVVKEVGGFYGSSPLMVGVC